MYNKLLKYWKDFSTFQRCILTKFDLREKSEELIEKLALCQLSIWIFEEDQYNGIFKFCLS